jgi:hypothetical protein
MMDSFGARLRRERERRHIALATIAASTKIKQSLFEELERDDASHWPSGIFRRSFIRAYAEAIGLPGDAIVKEFLERFPDPAAPGPVLAAPTAQRQVTVEVEPPPPAALRMVLDEHAMPDARPARPVLPPRRAASWAALVWDGGILVVIAALGFVIFDRFWMPLALGSIIYSLGGIAALGLTPGMWLWGQAARTETGSASTISASIRSRFRVKDRRVKDRRVRQVEPASIPFRTARRGRPQATS